MDEEILFEIKMEPRGNQPYRFRAPKTQPNQAGDQQSISYPGEFPWHQNNNIYNNSNAITALTNSSSRESPQKQFIHGQSQTQSSVCCRHHSNSSSIMTTPTTTTNSKSQIDLKHNHHHDSTKSLLQLIVPTRFSGTERKRQRNLFASSPIATIFHIVLTFLVTALIIGANHESLCVSIVEQFHPIGPCGLDLQEGSNNNHQHQEIIEPMVVIDTSSHELPNNNNHRTDSRLDQTAEEESTTKSIPLASAGKAFGCPNKLKIRFPGFGDRFVIDLVKNKRLISDRYFQVSKDTANRRRRRRRHPDLSSKKLYDNHNKYPNNNNGGHYEKDDDDFYKNHSFLNLHNFTTNDDHCHYHGYVNDNLSSISAISVVDFKLLSGLFYDGNEIYFLHANTTSQSSFLTKSSNMCISTAATTRNTSRPTDEGGHLFNESLRLAPIGMSASFLDGTISPKINHVIRSRRAVLASNNKSRRSSSANPDNYIRHEPFLSNSSSLYVELLVVHDHSQYIEYKGNASNIAERTMQIVNIMNAFYRQLNIFIALVGVVLWVEKDEIQLTEDGDSTLTNFLKYRYEKLLPKFHHDNAQLITSTSFNGSVVGKALKGPICTHEHSGGVNTDHSHSPAIVAVTLAHELGHNFGMEHDEEENCKCPDEKCIMSSSSSTVHPKHWSSCSIEYLEDARKHGLLDCLANKPEKAFGPICGNGFVEDGEDCDLGEPVPVYGSSSKNRKAAMRCALRGQDCDSSAAVLNPCCDRQTCKFVANATCAQGPCCDLSRCSVFNGTETKVCRPRKTECDFEEICDGNSEYCPQDVHYHDGIECGPTVSSSGRQPIVGSASYNRSRAYCYNGKCASHESQCQLLWGPSGSVSKDICYEQNIHGNTSGNCGYNWRDKFYDSCGQEDSICGMLHCVHNQPNVGDSRKTGKLGYGFESASVLTVSFFVMSNHAKIYCHGAIIDAGPNSRDPGLVPNGAACGEDKMCVDQKCTPVFEVVYKNWCPSDCNGNGICDNVATCHCFDGTIGTSCYQFFGPNFHLSLLLYIVMFFVPIVGLVVLAANHYRKKIKIWWFLHNRKIALRQKSREQNNLRRTAAYDVDGHKISISEPIPLAQNNNVNRPFYEPVLDPWTETNCDQAAGKPLGYRLVPLKKQLEHPFVNLNPPSVAAATITSTAPTDSQSTLKPVRAAPPPPSVTQHRQPPPVPPHAPKA